MMRTLDAGQVKRLKDLFVKTEKDKKDIIFNEKFEECHVEKFQFLQGQHDILVMVLEMIGEMDSMLG